MTTLDTREIHAVPMNKPVVRPGFRPADARRRPRSNRPAVAPMRYRGTGVVMSRATHRRRPITPATTVVLALIASAITVWLGLVAQFGGVTGGDAPVPDRLHRLPDRLRRRPRFKHPHTLPRLRRRPPHRF